MLNEEGRRALQWQAGGSIWNPHPKNAGRKLWLNDVAFFRLLVHRGFILPLETLMLMHSSVIHFCIYFPCFLPYFILLPKVTYMETEIFWGFLFKFLCFFYVVFFIFLFYFFCLNSNSGYPSWIASETRPFLTDKCPTKNRMAQLWHGCLQRRSCTLGNSNISPHIGLAFPAYIQSL